MASMFVAARVTPLPARLLRSPRGHRARISTKRASRPRKKSVDQPAIESAVSVDPPVPQEWPVRPMFVYAAPIDIGHHNFFLINRSFGDDFAIRSANKTLTPEFDSVATGGCFVADAICHCDVAPIRNGVATLNGFPRRMLRFAKLLLLARMPADSRRIKNILRTAQCSQPRCFGIPLVPAVADSDFAVPGVPRLEPKVAGGEIKFLVIERIVWNVHLAVLAEQLTVRVDDRGSVVINARAAPLE